MKRHMIQRLAIGGLLMLAGFSTALAETFSVKGTNPGGRGTYEGTVSVDEVKVEGTNNRVLSVVWKIGAVETDGIAMTMPGNANDLFVSYQSDNGAGIAKVTRHPDGTIDSVWLTPGLGKVGKEVWTPTK